MRTSKLSLFKACFPRVAFYAYMTEMQRLLCDCRTCLDIGCGANSPVRLLHFEHSVGLEAHEASLAQARESGTHSAFVLGRAQEVGRLFSQNQFDCVVALDLIEHLTKEEGHQLLRDMEKIAAKRILVFTPNGFISQESHDGDLQEHLSGWGAEEMQRLGFTVFGMLGPRYLRGEQHRHRIRPKMLSGVLSVLLHYLHTRARPDKAAALLCVKEIHKEESPATNTLRVS